MTWNRKYRPKQVKDLHLDFVRTQILRMMEAGKIPQAMLFAGPKGTGKTSTSRIIGAVVNDAKNEKIIDTVYFSKQKPKKSLSEPETTSKFADNIFAGTSFVVQEMDAASNRGIDDIRQLKTRAFLPPQEGKMSVFILDEAHMLTTEAFNALLKLLEEPPEHVIFILATTELHKIPETIVSRCQLVEFKKATEHEIVNRLKLILIDEKIEYDEEALTEIANYSDGSFRDAIKLLELASQSGKVTTKEVGVYISSNSTKEVETLLKHLLNKDEKAVVELFESLREKAVDPKFFHKAVLEKLHTSLLQNLQIKKGESVINKAVAQFLLQELSSSDLSVDSPIQHLQLELKILELIDRSKNKSGSGVKKNPKSVTQNSSSTKQASAYDHEEYMYEQAFQNEVNSFDTTSETIPTNTFSETIQPTPEKQIEVPQKPLKKVVETVDIEAYTGKSDMLQQNWNSLIEEFTITNSTLSALLRSATFVSAEDNKAVIGVYYTFHQEQLSQAKSIKAIQESIKKVAGGYVEISFIVIDTPKKADLVEVDQSDPLVASATQALM
jgi:DNA polymerase-3 subunit gamma/tau